MELRDIMSIDGMQQKNVHYFPGHMRKALNALLPMVKAADLVVEVVDARAPFSTRNQLFAPMVGNKPLLVVLSKSDKADANITKAWVEYFAKNGITAISSDLKKERVLNILSRAAEPLCRSKREKEAKLGMKKQPLRLLIVGIPNVGKSTLINNLAGKAVAKAGNKPGVTRAEQWIKISNDFVLLDTPGILPMHYEDKNQAISLALLGSIREEILPNHQLYEKLFDFLRTNYPNCMEKRFAIENLDETSPEAVLDAVAKKCGLLLNGGEPDQEKATLRVMKDFQNTDLGKISLERPE